MASFMTIRTGPIAAWLGMIGLASCILGRSGTGEEATSSQKTSGDGGNLTVAGSQGSTAASTTAASSSTAAASSTMAASSSAMASSSTGMMMCDPTCATCAAGCCTQSCATVPCVCQDNCKQCTFTCLTPPCVMKCGNNNLNCAGDCAGSTPQNPCTCGVGSTCFFACGTGGCDIDCQGSKTCAGACSNKDHICKCGGGATCNFSECRTDDNCVVTCDGANTKCTFVCKNGTKNCSPVDCTANASCILDCTAFPMKNTDPRCNAGKGKCDAAGGWQLCANGNQLYCGNAAMCK
jgi:hypothetical protein